MDHETHARYVTLRKAAKFAGPIALAGFILRPLLWLIGLAGIPGDVRTMIEWLSNPWVLQAILLVVGVWLTPVGYQVRLRYMWYGASFLARLRFPSGDSADRRLTRIRGAIDSLVRRAETFPVLADGAVSVRLREQWVRHVGAMVRRSLVRPAALQELASFNDEGRMLERAGDAVRWAIEQEEATREPELPVDTKDGVEWLLKFRERVGPQNARLD